MTTLLSQPPETPAEAAVAPVDVLADSGALLGVFEESPILIAGFRKPGYELAYANKTARAWLDPENSGLPRDATLMNFIGVNSMLLVKNHVLVEASVLGRWSGELTLRNIWGTELVVRATLTGRKQRGGGAGGSLWLQATRLDQAATITGIEPGASDRDLLQALLESTSDAIYFKDRHSRFVRVSRSLSEKVKAVAPTALVGRNEFDFFSADSAQRALAAEQSILATGRPIVDQEEVETHPDGTQTWVSVTRQALRDRRGFIVGTYGVSRDITARKQAERESAALQGQLQLAQKLESIGRLAAGIAHEINTPSQFITDNTHFLQDVMARLAPVFASYRELLDAVESGRDARAAAAMARSVENTADLDYLTKEIPVTLAQSLDGLNRIARIVRSLKEFSHPQNAKRLRTDLNHAIENAVTVSRHEWKYVADVVTEFDPQLPPVPCVVDEFNQVMLNLLINAAHAVGAVRGPEGTAPHGRITVRTRREEQHAVLEVEDTGIGIPEENRHRIFEPFFTTKPLGQGTGQGLSLVHTIVVQRHHGLVDFRSEVGRGTTFIIKLPLQPPEKKETTS